MGTSLTGLTPATTYDALIKVGDNGPLSATAKVLSDGLGNDSAMSLSTVSVGIGTATPSGNLHIESANPNSNLIASSGNAVSRIADSATSATRKELTTILDTTNNRVEIQAIQQGVATLPICINASGGNVGIGTTSPGGKFEVSLPELTNEDTNNQQAVFGNGVSSNGVRIGYNNTTGNGYINSLKPGVQWSILNIGSSNTIFNISGTERARFTANGLCFNGDTAAANALDDYEEGTWTMGVSFGGASVGVTYSNNTGTYTKIGRQVTVNGYLSLTNKGSSTGSAAITGLPFTIANTTGNYSTASLYLENVSFANQFMGLGITASTNTNLYEITEAGGTSNLVNTAFTNNSVIAISLIYFV